MKSFDERQMRDLGIALLRVTIGAVLLAHGSQKLFVFGINGTAGFFAHVGIPMPMLSAVLSIGAEFLGGLLLVLGLGTRWVAAVLAFNMAVAVFGVHLKGGFFLPTGMEYALTMLMANVALVLTGPGAFALDHLIARPRAERQDYRPGLAA